MVPMRDMKNAAAFTLLVERERSVTATCCGYEAFKEWAVRSDELAKAKLFSCFLLTEQEVERGEYIDFDEFAPRPKAEYCL